MKIFTLPLVFVFILSTTHAQNSNSWKKDTTGFKTTLTYLSNDVYYGRADTLIVPYITAGLKYTHKSGLYVSANLSYLASSYAQRIDQSQIEAGYEKDITENLSFALSAAKNFYNTNSISVKSTVLGEAGGTFSYSNNIVDIGMGSFVSFTSAKPDIIFNLNLSHKFEDDNNTWSIEPKFNLNFGSRNFYDKFINTRSKKSGKKTKTTPASDTVVTTNAKNPNKFVRLDYEFTAEMKYNWKHFGIFFNPTIAIPQNPSSIVTTTTITPHTGSPTITKDFSTEKNSTKFFSEVGLVVRF